MTLEEITNLIHSNCSRLVVPDINEYYNYINIENRHINEEPKCAVRRIATLSENNGYFIKIYRYRNNFIYNDLIDCIKPLIDEIEFINIDDMFDWSKLPSNIKYIVISKSNIIDNNFEQLYNLNNLKLIMFKTCTFDVGISNVES